MSRRPDTARSAPGMSRSAATRSPISPCLWFDHELEEAAEFYTTIFPNSSIGHMARYTEAGPGEPGTVMAGEFTLDGLTFRGINGGPEHAGFTETISFSVTCARPGRGRPLLGPR